MQGTLSRVTVGQQIILTVVRWMKFLEKLTFGLWAGSLAAHVAVLTSALPYIYTKEEAMRCGSLGLTNFAITMIPQYVGMIVIMAGICYIGRACISAN